jgi:hypothetical protein
MFFYPYWVCEAKGFRFALYHDLAIQLKTGTTGQSLLPYENLIFVGHSCKITSPMTLKMQVEPNRLTIYTQMVRK